MKLSAFNLIRGSVFTNGDQIIPFIVSAAHLDGNQEKVTLFGYQDGEPGYQLLDYGIEVELVGLSVNPDDLSDDNYGGEWQPPTTLEPVPWEEWRADAGISEYDEIRSDEAIDMAGRILDQDNVPLDVIERDDLQSLRASVQTLVEIVLAQRVMLSHQPYPCGLCGELVTNHLIDVDEAHACCGCGWRDATQDHKGWICPVCSLVKA